jgi:peptide/nickel transport system ATP-binding protein/oligopeptide transport system ATP-binding protein
MLLEVRDLVTVFETPQRRVTAVDHVSLQVDEGEVFGLVGESGSGKSAVCRSILKLFGGGNARIPAGEIHYRGQELTRLGERELSDIRGHEIGMIFQDPMSSLNPTMRIGRQIMEGIMRHGRGTVAEARSRAVELLRSVGVPSAENRLDDYPHQFSGGMRQRVLIAIALACRPRLLIADEPTTALDVTIQDQILKLILRLRETLAMSVLIVTHDLGIIAQICDRVAVMYAGRIVETADTRTLFKEPRHPYTQALLRSRPGLVERGRPLNPISGSPPDLGKPPPGCRFHPRCALALPECREIDGRLIELSPTHGTACVRHQTLA